MIYIYGLKCPLAGTIRYIGKSTNPTARYNAHVGGSVRGDYNHHTARWIRKLRRSGQSPELIILYTVGDGERWQDVERRFIASAEENGWKLTNSTRGGEGLDYRNEEDSKRYRAKLSKSLKELWNRAERRAEATARNLAVWANPILAERKIKAIKLAATRPEVQARYSAAGREIASRPDVKRRRTQKLIEQWANPEKRAARLAAFDAVVRAKMSASAKAKWADPEKTKKWFESRRSPELRARMSQSAKARATPEYRLMMAEKTRLSWEARRLKRRQTLENSNAERR